MSLTSTSIEAFETRPQQNWTALIAETIALVALFIAVFVTGMIYDMWRDSNDVEVREFVTSGLSTPVAKENRSSETNAPAPTADAYVRDGDTFSDLTYDLYGNGTKDFVEAARAGVIGLRNPMNPNYVVSGDYLQFSCTIVVNGKTVYANKFKAKRRWRWRHDEMQQQAKPTSHKISFVRPVHSVIQTTMPQEPIAMFTLAIGLPGYSENTLQVSSAGQPVPPTEKITPLPPALGTLF